ncbi:MAG TPA: hypothetical protein VHR39_11515 [Propionibacteriaceae bacterium]|nr:hypothetical protein [Propionibacteriaceae bacterium]
MHRRDVGIELDTQNSVCPATASAPFTGTARRAAAAENIRTTSSASGPVDWIVVKFR